MATVPGRLKQAIGNNLQKVAAVDVGSRQLTQLNRNTEGVEKENKLAVQKNFDVVFPLCKEFLFSHAVSGCSERSTNDRY